MATNGGDVAAAEYRSDIDGLRAVAVVAVLLFHAFPNLAPGGFVGVDIFFVISGFLITGIIHRGIGQRSFSIGGFYLRRVRRIFPALLIVLGCCLIAGWIYFTPPELMQLGKNTAGAALFASNFFYWAESGYFDSAAITKPLLHLWSLGIEEQFYLVWPLLILLSARKGKSRAFVLAVMAASLAACVWTTAPFSYGAFYSPATRMWALALGGFLALSGWNGKAGKRRWLAELSSLGGIVLIAAAIWSFDPLTPYPSWRALLPTVGAGMVIAAGGAALLNRYLLSNPVMVFAGLISYPLYLWHWPLLSFAHIIGLGIVSTQLKIGMLAASVGLAIGTYLLVDQPLRRGLLSWRLGGGMVAIMACIAVAGGATYESAGRKHAVAQIAKVPLAAAPAPAPVPKDLESVPPDKPIVAEPEKPPKSEPVAAKVNPILLYREHLAEAQKSRGNWIGYFQEMAETRLKAVRHAICEPGEIEAADGGLKDTSSCGGFVSGATNIVVMGDSIGSDTYAWLKVAYPEYNFIQKTGTGCHLQRRVDPKSCEAVFKDGLDIALSPTEKVDAVVLACAWDTQLRYPGDWYEDPTTTPIAATLLAGGVRVILMGPPVGFTIPTYELIEKCPGPSKDSLTLEELTQCAWQHSTLYRKTSAVMKKSAQEKGMAYVDVNELACNNDRYCPVIDDEGQAMFLDTTHRSFPGDVVIGRRARERHTLERILGKR